MLKIVKKFLNTIKINKKIENAVVIGFLIIATLVGYFANELYKKSEVNDNIQKLELAFKFESNKVTQLKENMFLDLNAMCYYISQDLNDEKFDEYIDLYKEDFKYCDYVGILKDGKLIKGYYPQGDYEIDSSELGLSFYKLEQSTNDYQEDVFYFVNTSNDVCSLVIKPIYFQNGNEKIYYGELVFRINITKYVENNFELESYGFTKNVPWKMNYKFASGTSLSIYSFNGLKISDPITININDDEVSYVFTISDDIVYNALSTNSMRFIVLFIVICFTSLALKFLFVSIRKQSDMETLNDTKLDFFTNIVYEVRTSTNSIVGYCNEAEKEQLSVNVKGYLDSSKLELKKLLHKINNILDITNLTEGKQNLYEEEYYIHILIQEIIDEYKSEVESRDLKFIVDISNSLPIKLFGQKNIIKKSICHLIDSALANIIDGHIKISVFGNFTSSNRKNIDLKIIVTDTGIGIKEGGIKDVFVINNFKDSSSDDTKVEMAIASELCKTIGGNLKINSEYGKGTVCTIEINQKVLDDRMMTEEMLKGIQEKYRRNLGPLKKVHANILIVDDNDVNLSVLRNVIRIYGADVDSAKSGLVAFELASVKDYDMIIIDYLMPEIDGYETLRRIRNINKKYKQIPAVLVSANTFSKESDFKDAGFNDYLQKPITQKDIERILKCLLNIELIECELKNEEI